MPVGVLDKIEDLHDRRVHHLGRNWRSAHRHCLCFGITGMHQALSTTGRPLTLRSRRGDQPSPPCAMQLTSYWPATDVPGFSCGRNECWAAAIGTPTLLKLPWSPSRTGRRDVHSSAEPLGLRHTGLVIRASSGSISGARRISTRPPPSRLTGRRPAGGGHPMLAAPVPGRASDGEVVPHRRNRGGTPPGCSGSNTVAGPCELGVRRLVQGERSV